MEDTTLGLIVGSYFVWWSLFCLLERKLGMAPRLYTAATIQQMDARIAGSRGKETLLATRSTRSVGATGAFRMQARPATQYVKAVWQLSLLVTAVAQLLVAGGWERYVDLFYRMDPAAIQMPCCQIAASLVLSWYLFEIPLLLQYRRLDPSEMVHHWLTIAAAIAVLSGVFAPYSIWYGIVLLGGVFPIGVFRGFRRQLGPRYPELTRRFARALAYGYPVLIGVGVLGTLAILAHGAALGVFGPVTVGMVGLSMLGWCHDDMKLARHLMGASKEHYEDLNVGSAQRAILRLVRSA